MSLRLEVSDRAAAEIRAAADWWAENRLLAPDLFADEVEHAFALMRALPGIGEPVEHPRLPNLRRLLLTGTRYHLYYRLSNEQQSVEVLGLWHTARGREPHL